jgi:hypothetical protein
MSGKIMNPPASLLMAGFAGAGAVFWAETRPAGIKSRKSKVISVVGLIERFMKVSKVYNREFGGSMGIRRRAER